jgi:hypothetical protein
VGFFVSFYGHSSTSRFCLEWKCGDSFSEEFCTCVVNWTIYRMGIVVVFSMEFVQTLRPLGFGKLTGCSIKKEKQVESKINKFGNLYYLARPRLI